MATDKKEFDLPLSLYPSKWLPSAVSLKLIWPDQ